MTLATTARSARIVSPPASRTAVAAPPETRIALDLGARAHLAARVADDSGEPVDEHDAATFRHRHAAELERAGDHLGHEAGRRLVGAEARVQDPRREEAVRGVRLERVAEPVAAGRRAPSADELEQAAPSEAAQRLAAEAEARRRPELGAEDAERQVGVRHEAVEHRLPGGAVRRRVARELGDVVLERGRRETRLEPSGNAAPVGSSVFRYSSPRRSSSGFSSAYAAEPVKSGCHEASTSCVKPGAVRSDEVRMQPPSSSSRSSTQTLQPAFASSAAPASELIPEPTKTASNSGHRRAT